MRAIDENEKNEISYRNRLKSIEEKEIELRKEFNDFCREIEAKDEFRIVEMRKNEDLYETAGNNPELLKLIEERDSILNDMKAECNRRFEEFEEETKKSLKKLSEERDLIKSNSDDKNKEGMRESF